MPVDRVPSASERWKPQALPELQLLLDFANRTRTGIARSVLQYDHVNPGPRVNLEEGAENESEIIAPSLITVTFTRQMGICEACQLNRNSSGKKIRTRAAHAP